MESLSLFPRVPFLGARVVSHVSQYGFIRSDLGPVMTFYPAGATALNGDFAFVVTTCKHESGAAKSRQGRKEGAKEGRGSKAALLSN